MNTQPLPKDRAEHPTKKGPGRKHGQGVKHGGAPAPTRAHTPKPTWVAVKPQPTYPEHVAPPGTIYVCGACGKTARDIYDGPGSWDESCMLNAVLCHEPKATGAGS